MEGMKVRTDSSGNQRDGEIPPWPMRIESLERVPPRAEVGRTWQAVRLDDVPNLLGSLFATSDLWIEVIHLELRFLQQPSNPSLRCRADVSVRGALPPELPPGGYLPSGLLIDYLHSYRDWLSATADEESSLNIGANRGGMFWRIIDCEELGRANQVP